MRTICKIIVLLLPLSSCRGTKFNYVSNQEVHTYGNLNPINIQDNYNLFVRKVIKVFDSAQNLYVPINGDPDYGGELIELQYLLVSKSNENVIVINNIPNKRKSFYNSPDKRKDVRGLSDSLTIDIWYFNQFRFGKVDKNENIMFENLSEGQKKHIWNVERKANIIKLSSISFADKFGTDLRELDEAFALPMVFRKVDKFKMVFKNNAGKGLNDSRAGIDLLKQTFFVAKKNNKWYIIFSFGAPVKSNFRNIVFFDERVYSAPSDIK